MRVVTVAEMKQIEKNAAESGLSYYQMMENAGEGAAHFVRQHFPPSCRTLIVAGKGNNGGDGYVAARLLTEAGYSVTILMPEGGPVTEDASKNYQLCLEKNIPILPLDPENLPKAVETFQLILDAMYGTGFHGSLLPNASAVAQAVNASHATVIALDIPSGINGDTGETDRNAFVADYTLAFDSLKRAHVAPSVSPHCGTVLCLDIGIPEHCHKL